MRVLLVAVGVTLALAALLWPRRAPQSAGAEPAPAVGHEPSRARDASEPSAARLQTDASASPVDPDRRSEAALMEAARTELAHDPARTLALIEAADGRFGPNDESRRLLEIEALVKLERIGLSHAKAERFYQAFPGSPAARRIEQLTGYHPRPWGPRREDE